MQLVRPLVRWPHRAAVAVVLSLVGVCTPAAAAVGAGSIAHGRYLAWAQGIASGEDVLVGLAAAATTGLLLHLTVLVGCGVVDGVRTGLGSVRRSPAWREAALPGRAISLTVATVLATVLLAPAAQALSGPAPGTGGGAVATDQSEATAVAGSWTALASPDQAGPPSYVAPPVPVAPDTSALVTAPATRPAHEPRQSGAAVVVVAGDSLWAIAAAHLGPDATDTEVAAAWPRWWQHNHDVIGDAPDLLHPGLLLTPPPA